MKRSVPENIMLVISALLVIMILMLFTAPVVYATGKDNDNSVNTDVNVNSDITTGAVDVSTGSVNTGGNSSRSLALGNVLGDVDIAGCLGSTQWSTPVYGKQKLSLNWVCVAEFYIKYQQPELAAMALCNTDILKEFTSEEECEQAHQFLVQAAVQPTSAPPPPVEDDRIHDAQTTQLMELQSQIEQLQELYERRPTRTVTREVIQQPFLSDEKKDKLREIVK